MLALKKYRNTKNAKKYNNKKHLLVSQRLTPHSVLMGGGRRKLLFHGNQYMNLVSGVELDLDPI